MLKAIAAGVVIAVGFGGAVIAQPIRVLPPGDPVGAVLVKHDKEDNGRGRKLGHYKQRSDDANDDENRSRRSSARSRATTSRSGNYYAPSPYYGAPPGYSNSYPAPYYDYYQPPYYRGY